jgi:hypothetical protein
VADVVLELGGALAALIIGVSGLRMKDLIQRGLVRRRMARLAASSARTALPAGRVACPECGIDLANGAAVSVLPLHHHAASLTLQSWQSLRCASSRCAVPDGRSSEGSRRSRSFGSPAAELGL